MLILTRRVGESINIGDDIKVTILGVYGRQTRIGIDAPLKVKVHREEVYDRINSENNETAGAKKKSGILHSAIAVLSGNGEDTTRSSGLKVAVRHSTILAADFAQDPRVIDGIPFTVNITPKKCVELPGNIVILFGESVQDYGELVIETPVAITPNVDSDVPEFIIIGEHRIHALAVEEGCIRVRIPHLAGAKAVHILDQRGPLPNRRRTTFRITQ